MNAYRIYRSGQGKSRIESCVWIRELSDGQFEVVEISSDKKFEPVRDRYKKWKTAHKHFKRAAGRFHKRGTLFACDEPSISQFKKELEMAAKVT